MEQLPPTYLKLHVDEPSLLDSPPLDEPVGFAPLCGAFVQATGWSLQYVPAADSPTSSTACWSCDVPDGEGTALGKLLLSHDAPGTPDVRSPAQLDDVQPLAASIGDLLGELNRTRRTAWRQAAELATAIPVAGRADEQEHLARRLEAVMRGGAEAVGCQAAALYLLDDATTELSLRSAWGLPSDRLLAAARPVAETVADVEALAGHAVVLEDASLLPHWRSPEDFASAVCVPVASPTMVLGTLWMFCTQTRDFTDQQTNLVEIIAGRLAADLEREVLLREGVAARESDRQFESVAGQQQGQLPQIAPLVDGWQVAGWTERAEQVGGDFHDWFVVPDGSLALAIGHADGPPLSAAMTTATLSAALKAHSNYPHDARQMVQRVNETLWESGTGDRFAALLYAMVDPDRGRVELAAAGYVGALVLQSHGWQQVPFGSERLGSDLELEVSRVRQDLERADALVMVTEGYLRSVAGSSHRQKLDALGKALHKRRDASAEDLAAAARRFHGKHGSPAVSDDRTVLVVKRV